MDDTGPDSPDVPLTEEQAEVVVGLLRGIGLNMGRDAAATIIEAVGRASAAGRAEAIGEIIREAAGLAEGRGALHALNRAATDSLQAILGEDTVSSMEREQISDMVAASEARNETSLAKAMGEMRTEFAALRGEMQVGFARTAGKGTVIATGITLFFGIAALLAAFLAYGSDRFSAGMDSSAIAQAAADRAVAAATASSQVKPPAT